MQTVCLVGAVRMLEVDWKKFDFRLQSVESGHVSVDVSKHVADTRPKFGSSLKDDKKSHFWNKSVSRECYTNLTSKPLTFAKSRNARDITLHGITLQYRQTFFLFQQDAFLSNSP